MAVGKCAGRLHSKQKKILTNNVIYDIIDNVKGVIDMTREQMMDKIIKKYGFEDTRTIWFCNLCEDKTVTDYTIENAYIVLETMKSY